MVMLSQHRAQHILRTLEDSATLLRCYMSDFTLRPEQPGTSSQGDKDYSRDNTSTSGDTTSSFWCLRWWHQLSLSKRLVRSLLIITIIFQVCIRESCFLSSPASISGLSNKDDPCSYANKLDLEYLDFYVFY